MALMATFHGASTQVAPALGLALLPLVPFITPCGLLAVATWLMLLYKAWAAIDDGHGRTTPRAAIGLLFIPLYNMYRLYQVTVGFAHDYNRFAERHGIQTVRMEVELGQGWYVCVLVTLIPFVNFLAAPCLWVLTLAMMADMSEAINAIADAQAGRGSLR